MKFFRSCYFIQLFLSFLKNAPEYIDPFGHFVLYEILCSSKFLVERHLDDVLEVLLVVGLKFIFYTLR